MVQNRDQLFLDTDPVEKQGKFYQIPIFHSLWPPIMKKKFSFGKGIDEPDFLMSTAKRDQYGCNKAKKENLFSLENIKKNSQIVKGDNYRFTCYFFYTIQYLFCDMRQHSLSRSVHIYLYTLFYLTFFLTSFFTFSFLSHARIITTICSIEKCGVLAPDSYYT
jgi:hypothetical protein